MGPASTGQDETPNGQAPGSTPDPTMDTGATTSVPPLRTPGPVRPAFRTPPPRPTTAPRVALPDVTAADLPVSGTGLGSGDQPSAGESTSRPPEAREATRRERKDGPRSGHSDRPPERTGSTAEGDQSISAVTGWKVATAFLTVVAVLGVGWGVYQTTKLSRTEAALKSAGASAATQLQSLDARVAALEAANAKYATDLANLQQQLTGLAGNAAAAQQSFSKVQDTISITPADYKGALGQSPALSAAFLTAKAAADSAPGDQESQLKSLEAKSALLTNCARIWAGATQQIYTSGSLQDTMGTVGTDLSAAAPDCKIIAS